MSRGAPLDLLQGTLDMLVLKAVSLGPLHGYGVLLRIQQISRNRLEIQQGSLYPALYLPRRDRRTEEGQTGSNLTITRATHLVNIPSVPSAQQSTDHGDDVACIGYGQQTKLGIDVPNRAKPALDRYDGVPINFPCIRFAAGFSL
jgi:hypothetical protein